MTQAQAGQPREPREHSLLGPYPPPPLPAHSPDCESPAPVTLFLWGHSQIPFPDEETQARRASGSSQLGLPCTPPHPEREAPKREAEPLPGCVRDPVPLPCHGPTGLGRSQGGP